MSNLTIIWSSKGILIEVKKLNQGVQRGTRRTFQFFFSAQFYQSK